MPSRKHRYRITPWGSEVGRQTAPFQATPVGTLNNQGLKPRLRISQNRRAEYGWGMATTPQQPTLTLQSATPHGLPDLPQHTPDARHKRRYFAAARRDALCKVSEPKIEEGKRDWEVSPSQRRRQQQRPEWGNRGKDLPDRPRERATVVSGPTRALQLSLNIQAQRQTVKN